MKTSRFARKQKHNKTKTISGEAESIKLCAEADAKAIELKATAEAKAQRMLSEVVNRDVITLR